MVAMLVALMAVLWAVEMVVSWAEMMAVRKAALKEPL